MGWPLGGLFALWIVGRIAVAVSAAIPPVIVAVADLFFPVLLAAAVARKIVKGRDGRNLLVLAMLGILILGNAVFHWEAVRREFAAQGTGLRLGLGAGIMMIAVIGGRIVPSFSRNWLVKRQSPVLPTPPMQRFDKLALLILGLALSLWVMAPYAVVTGLAIVSVRGPTSVAAGALDRPPDPGRAAGAGPACRLRFRPARRFRTRHGNPLAGCARVGGSAACLDGGGTGPDDTGGDDPRYPRPYGASTDDRCGDRLVLVDADRRGEKRFWLGPPRHSRRCFTPFRVLRGSPRSAASRRSAGACFSTPGQRRERMVWVEFSAPCIGFGVLHSVPVRLLVRPWLVEGLGQAGVGVASCIVWSAKRAALLVAADPAPSVPVWAEPPGARRPVLAAMAGLAHLGASCGGADLRRSGAALPADKDSGLERASVDLPHGNAAGRRGRAAVTD